MPTGPRPTPCGWARRWQLVRARKATFSRPASPQSSRWRFDSCRGFAAETPEPQRHMNLQRPCGAAPVSQQFLDGCQALADGVDVDAKPLRRHLRVLVAVEITHQ